MNEKIEKCAASIQNLTKVRYLSWEKDIKYPNLKKKRQDNKKYLNKYKGQRCFVIGNGPSLRQQDLRLLEREVVFTVNDFSSHPDLMKIKPNFHLFADPLYFDEKPIFQQDMLRQFKEMCLKENEPTFFVHSMGYDVLNKLDMDQKYDVHFFTPLYNFEDQVLHYDFCKCITCFSTVVQYAIALAIYMGFSEIYLLGCDCTGIIEYCKTKEGDFETQGHFYDLTEEQKEVSKKGVPNLQSEAVFQGWTDMLRGYRMLGKWCSKNNVLLANATSGGVLDSLPRIEYSTLF